MIAFVIVTDLFRTTHFVDFEDSHLGTGLSCAPPSLTPSHHLPPPRLSSHRSSVVHQLVIMGLQLRHRIRRHLDWEGG